MRPSGTPQQLQKRRVRAIALLKSGKSLSAVGRAVSASPSSVGRWRDAFQQQGYQGLQPQPIPGRPALLSSAQKRKLIRILLRGPIAAGYKTDLWTLKRIARIIRQQFGISYHPGHVWKILIQLHWSCQKPERRALQRDEAAIAHWKHYVWPRLKKKASYLGAHLVFADESGFLLIPNLKRTWAPKGETPIIRHSFRRTKVSAMTALAVSPKRKQIALYLQLRSHNFKGRDVQRFLKYLLKHLRGPILLLWDGNPVHRDAQVQHWIARHPRLQVEEFPGYAPELNPAEYVWMHADSDLANGIPEELADLMTALTKSKRRLRRSQDLLWACIYASDLPWTD